VTKRQHLSANYAEKLAPTPTTVIVYKNFPPHNYVLITMLGLENRYITKASTQFTNCSRRNTPLNTFSRDLSVSKQFINPLFNFTYTSQMHYPYKAVNISNVCANFPDWQIPLPEHIQTQA
jgi:hypothetical protein